MQLFDFIFSEVFGNYMGVVVSSAVFATAVTGITYGVYKLCSFVVDSLSDGIRVSNAFDNLDDSPDIELALDSFKRGPVLSYSNPTIDTSNIASSSIVNPIPEVDLNTLDVDENGLRVTVLDNDNYAKAPKVDEFIKPSNIAKPVIYSLMSKQEYRDRPTGVSDKDENKKVGP